MEMASKLLSDLQQAWRAFKVFEPDWGADFEDEETAFLHFCELELLGPELVVELLRRGYFKQWPTTGNC